MNFIAHYYFDRKDNNDYYNFGLILPDLMSAFKRGWKIKEHYLERKLSARNILIISGVLQHYKRDANFHGSEYFFKYTEILKNIIIKEKVPYPFPGKHFISHILLELTLDKVIIQNNSDILIDFYENINKIDEEILKSLFEDTTVQFREGFLEFYDKFKTNKFAYKYVDKEIIVDVLNRILTKVSLPTFSEKDQIKSISNCISIFELILLENFHELNSLVILDVE